MIRVIPAIDIIDGRCVRLSQGAFDQKTVYEADPVDVARSCEDNGLAYLHVVDLDGARAGKPVNLSVLESMASATHLHIDFGGGIRDAASVSAALDAGARQLTVGSVAVRQPDLFLEWMTTFGTDKFILAADVRDGQVAVSGWTESSGRLLESVLEWFLSAGGRTALVTEVSRDGMLEGTASALYDSIKTRFPGLFLIASGGVGSLQDIEELNTHGIDAVVVGKAIHEGLIPLSSLSAYAD